MTAPAEPIATNPLPSAIRTLWRVVAVVQAVVIVVAGVVVGILGDLFAATIGLVVAAAVFLALRLWVINLAFDRWRWGIDHRWIERRSGVLIRTTQVVPRTRVQTLTTKTGPIDRWLGLSSIVIHTAGTHTPNLTIPHLENEAAEQLRSELAG